MPQELSRSDVEEMIDAGYWKKGHPISVDRFRKIQVPYWDFEGAPHDDGEIIMLDIVSDSIKKAFKSLHNIRFPIHQVNPHHKFAQSDTTGEQNSANGLQRLRKIVNDNINDTRTSIHSFGLALDINYRENPFIGKDAESPETDNGATNCLVWPANSLKYLNPEKIVSIEASSDRFAKCQLFWPNTKQENLDMYKEGVLGRITPIVRNILGYHGFCVNGAFDWSFPIDLHHFQAGERPFCEALAKADKSTGEKMWKEHLRKVRKTFLTPSL